MPFAGRHPSVTVAEFLSKCRRPFALFVTVTYVTGKGWKNDSLETRTVFDSNIVDLYSSFVAK